MYFRVIALLFSIAQQHQVDPYFVTAIALTENRKLDHTAINVNRNGSVDFGIMQLNSSWYTDDRWYEPQRNITAAVSLIKTLIGRYNGDMHKVAVAYNCGRVVEPPARSIRYANRVLKKRNELWEVFK